MSSGPRGFQHRLVGTVVRGPTGVSYHLRELIGEGGQGWVFKANYDDPDGFWVVVKVLRQGESADATHRFEREADVLRRLGAAPNPNPNIVRFYDYGVHPVSVGRATFEVPFLVLEYIPGQSLANVLDAARRGLPVARVRRIARQVARALAFVHEQKIVHRDLKPSNILLAEVQGQEVAKVTDFGIVKIAEPSVYRTESLAGATLGYAPPEQYESGNSRVTPQTDVFSFAAIIFETLSGELAFPASPGESPLRVVARMLGGERPSLLRPGLLLSPELVGAVSRVQELDRILGRALAPDPDRRPKSIRTLWEDIEPLLADTAVSAQGLVDEVSMAGPPRLGAPQSLPPPQSWRVVGRPMTGERLRCASIAADGTIVALGGYGLYRFTKNTWATLGMPQGVDPRFVRGVFRLADGALLLYGDNGFAMRLTPAGASSLVPVPHGAIAIHGAFEDARGLVLVGEGLDHSSGVVLELSGGRVGPVVPLPRANRLTCAVRTQGSLVVGGMGGFLGSAPEGAVGGPFKEVRWGRTGHVFGLAALSTGGAVMVGSGGHALALHRDAEGAWSAVLETVQTTRDLVAVTVGPAGDAWAVGGEGRLLRRAPSLGGEATTWMRVALPEVAHGQLVGVGVQSSAVTVVQDDGLVVEGRA